MIHRRRSQRDRARARRSDYIPRVPQEQGHKRSNRTSLRSRVPGKSGIRSRSECLVPRVVDSAADFCVGITSIPGDASLPQNELSSPSTVRSDSLIGSRACRSTLGISGLIAGKAGASRRTPTTPVHGARGDRRTAGQRRLRACPVDEAKSRRGNLRVADARSFMPKSLGTWAKQRHTGQCWQFHTGWARTIAAPSPLRSAWCPE
jgi:hypothetical protein